MASEDNLRTNPTEEKIRTNSISRPGGKNYYLSITELVEADDDRLRVLTDELTKEWLIWLLKDTVAHLREAKSTSFI